MSLRRTLYDQVQNEQESERDSVGGYDLPLSVSDLPLSVSVTAKLTGTQQEMVEWHQLKVAEYHKD